MILSPSRVAVLISLQLSCCSLLSWSNPNHLGVAGVAGFILPQKQGRSRAASVVSSFGKKNASQSRITFSTKATLCNDNAVRKSSKILAVNAFPQNEEGAAFETERRRALSQERTAAFTESVSRSALKTLVWRLLSSVVTLQATLLYTRQIQDVIKIFIASFLPKFATLFVLDRFVNRMGATRRATSNLERSLIKVLAWRAFSMLINLGFCLCALKDFSIASKIVSTDLAMKTVLMVSYERLWNQVGWGTQPVATSDTEDAMPTMIAGAKNSGGERTGAMATSVKRNVALEMAANNCSEQDTPFSLTTSQRATPAESSLDNSSVESLAERETDLFSWENQWYPVMPTNYLSGLDPTKPVPVSILGRKLVIWNSDSKANVNTTGSEYDAAAWSIFEDICPHRRSPLSTGQVKEGCLTCRYHGWQFDANGGVAKFPMRLAPEHSTDATPAIQANSFPSQAAGGLLWVFLGKREELFPLPSEIVAAKEQTKGADWMFNRNPISYISMMENTFDPAHAPWTHEQMVGFAGMSFSPADAIPMTYYDAKEPPTLRGFSLEHTPYQNSTARVAGPNSRTIRTFIPPCTVSVSSPPFFETKMWFVPADRYETNVLSFFGKPETRWIRWTRRLPKLQELIRDHQHATNYLSDWNYRFLSQDRITMQGQDMRKVGKPLRDLTPHMSDNGVATFQDWLQSIGGERPSFPGLAVNQAPDLFSRELSFWESHGRYCPRCQRWIQRVSKTKKWASTWSRGTMVGAVFSALLVAVGTTSRNRISHWMTNVLPVVSLNLLAFSLALRFVVDWCQQKELRMHSVGADLWPPHKSVFGYHKDVK